jgi:hypothetical protein
MEMVDAEGAFTDNVKLCAKRIYTVTLDKLIVGQSAMSIFPSY